MVSQRAKNGLFLCVLCVLCVCTAGCGYALAGRGSFLPEYIKTIGVPAFVNRTTVFNLETLLTQKVRAWASAANKIRISDRNNFIE